MLYNIIGIIYIGVSIWQGVFILNNKKDMPFEICYFKKENYQIINKDKFNSIMIKQSLILFIWILLSGILCILFKTEIGIVLPSLSIFANMVFAGKAKKYIKPKLQ